MKTLATWKIPALLAGLAISTCGAADMPKEFYEAEGPNVRVLRHEEDGSLTRFTRSPDSKRLTAKKFSASGVLTMMTVYTMYPNGDFSGCKIFDGQNQLMFKISYGYRKSDGLLVAENMYDARVVRKDTSGREMPVRVTKYVYDAQGNRSKPIVFSLLPGKTYEEVFGVKSSDIQTNPFKEKSPQKANPNARPVGR